MKRNAIPGVAEITEQGGSETPLTKEADVKAKIKELEDKGYELVSNTYPEGGKFDKDKDTDQEFKVTLKAKEVTVTPDQPKHQGLQWIQITQTDLNTQLDLKKKI